MNHRKLFNLFLIIYFTYIRKCLGSNFEIPEMDVPNQTNNNSNLIISGKYKKIVRERDQNSNITKKQKKMSNAALIDYYCPFRHKIHEKMMKSIANEIVKENKGGIFYKQSTKIDTLDCSTD